MCCPTLFMRRITGACPLCACCKTEGLQLAELFFLGSFSDRIFGNLLDLWIVADCKPQFSSATQMSLLNFLSLKIADLCVKHSLQYTFWLGKIKSILHVFTIQFYEMSKCLFYWLWCLQNVCLTCVTGERRAGR